MAKNKDFTDKRAVKKEKALTKGRGQPKRKEVKR